MQTSASERFFPVVFWAVLAGVTGVPVLIAAMSPLLVGREMVYIVGGFAGIMALVLLIMQPLLAASYLPGIRQVRARRWHQWTGSALVVAVLLHVVGLYLTSPPDMIDALLLVAPTLYSIFGVIGMWALIFIVLLVIARPRTGRRIRMWRVLHNSLGVVVVAASVVHALMIEGAMGYYSKLVLCMSVLVATVVVTIHLRWFGRRTERGPG